MPEIKEHKPGNFCWFELATSDWQAAKKFYTSLLGLTANEVPMEPGQPPYVILQKGGKDVGALYQQPPEQKGYPPNWTTYVAVTSADETAAKAKKLGGKLMMDPFDVFDFGRMTMIADPQGAMIAVWQAKKNPGATIMGEPGTVCWAELMADDVDKAKKFYTELFGWKTKAGGDYTEWQVGSEPIGGMMKKPDPNMPSVWLIYFAVDNLEASTKKAKSLGAQAHMELQDIPNVGQFSFLADPQGAMFYLIKITNA